MGDLVERLRSAAAYRKAQSHMPSVCDEAADMTNPALDAWKAARSDG